MDLSRLFDNTVQLGTIGDFLALLAAAVFLGIFLSDSYRRYFRQEEFIDASLMRSLIILTPSLFTMFWLMKASPALSIGLLGSLAMIRFRTSVKRMEDASFIFLSVAVAISTSMSWPILGLILILGVYGYGFYRRTRASKTTSAQQALFTVNIPAHLDAQTIIDGILTGSVQAEIVSVRTFDGITSIVFKTLNLDYKNNFSLQQKINSIDPKIQINVFYPESNLGHPTP